MKSRVSHIALQVTAVLFAGLLCAGAPEKESVITVGAFSKAPGLTPFTDGWKPVLFRKTDPTQYTLVEMDGTRVLQARSENAASGISKKIKVDPVAYPILQWRWRVKNVLESGDFSRKKGDDFAARLFVTFAYDPSNLPLKEHLKYKTLRLFGYKEVPVRALSYVWANKAPTGTIADNAHTSWVKMIVLRSKETHLNHWYVEERNLDEDYRAVFGEPSPAITSITLMTDTDNTGESTTAYFGDIHLRAAR